MKGREGEGRKENDLEVQSKMKKEEGIEREAERDPIGTSREGDKIKEGGRRRR